jgi:hypothetical protein
MSKNLEQLHIGQMSEPQLHERLMFLSRVSKSMCGTMLVRGENGETVAKPLGEAVSQFCADIAGSLNDPAKKKLREEFLRKVETGDPEARKQFCALKLESYDNYLIAQLSWIPQYFEIINLGDNERPVVENTTGSEITCYYVNRRGKPDMITLERDHVDTVLPLRMLTTPLVRTTEWDLYRGSIVNAAAKALTLTRDLSNKMEFEAKTLLDAKAFGTFTFTGAKATWPFVTNSYVNKKNLPDTNDISVDGPDFFKTLDAIIDYAARWSGLSALGDLHPTGVVRLASKNVKDFGSGTSASGYQFQQIQAGQLEKGWTQVQYRGINWTFKGDPTLDPDDRYAYPEFNQKAGRVFFKPSSNRSYNKGANDDFALFEKGEREQAEQRVFAAYINNATRRCVARFQFQELE